MYDGCIYVYFFFEILMDHSSRGLECVTSPVATEIIVATGV
jgi:hypothetical protein